jgi:hypothetical protein
MSEMVYAALALAALYLFEDHERERTGQAKGIWAGAIIGLAFLANFGNRPCSSDNVNSMFRREWRKAILPVGVASLFVLTWMAWTFFNKPPVQGVNAAYYSGYSSGIDQTLTDLQLLNNTSRLATILNVCDN